MEREEYVRGGREKEEEKGGKRKEKEESLFEETPYTVPHSYTHTLSHTRTKGWPCSARGHLSDCNMAAINIDLTYRQQQMQRRRRKKKTRRSPTPPPAAMAMITVLVSGPLGGSGVVRDSAECRATSHDITACTHS